MHIRSPSSTGMYRTHYCRNTYQVTRTEKERGQKTQQRQAKWSMAKDKARSSREETCPATTKEASRGKNGRKGEEVSTWNPLEGRKEERFVVMNKVRAKKGFTPEGQSWAMVHTGGQTGAQSEQGCWRREQTGHWDAADPLWTCSRISASLALHPHHFPDPQNQTWKAERGHTPYTQRSFRQKLRRWLKR